MKIGFIGLGIMGKPMCKNIIKAGYDTIIYSSQERKKEELKQLGAEVAQTILEVGKKSDVIITMLPNSPEVKEVILGEGSLMESTKPGTVIIDMSSIAPLVSQEIAKELKKKNVEFLDAPVSGGEPKAIDGTLSVMVGGDRDVYEKCLPILKSMAGSVVLTGPVGSGNGTKLANQVIVALNIAAMSEAMVLVSKMGIDPEVVYHAIRGGLAGSTVLDAKMPTILNRNFDPGFKLDLHLKDLNNVMETSYGVGVPLPLTASVREMIHSLTVDGKGNEDHSGLIKYFEKLANMEVESEV